MGHGAEGRDPPALAGERGGRAIEAGDVGGPGGEEPRLRAVRPPQSEVHEPGGRRREPEADRLRGDEGGVVEQRDESRLDELRLRERRRHPQQRFFGKEDGPLGHGVHVPGEAQIGEPVDEGGGEAGLPAEPLEFGGFETQAFEVVEGVRQPRGQQEVAIRGETADEELEHGRLVHAVLPVRLEHGELVPGP